MIVATEDLHRHRGEVAMVDGGFDPLHAGHVRYFYAAAELGAPVLCNVSSDDWVSQKHPVLLPQDERVEVIDALKPIAFTHLAQATTEDVLEALRPRFYVKGADWRGRLPEQQVEICARHGTEIVFLDTPANSSSRILRDLLQAMTNQRLSTT